MGELLRKTGDTTAVDREEELISRFLGMRMADYIRRGVDVPAQEVLDIVDRSISLGIQVRELEGEVAKLQRKLNATESNYDDALRRAEGQRK